MTKQTLKEFRDGWSYEFRVWEPQFASLAVALVKQEDRSEPYEMNRAQVFRLKNDKYAFVGESGCSCYESRDAIVEVYRTKQEALAAMDKWWGRYAS